MANTLNDYFMSIGKSSQEQAKHVNTACQTTSFATTNGPVSSVYPQPVTACESLAIIQQLPKKDSCEYDKIPNVFFLCRSIDIT